MSFALMMLLACLIDLAIGWPDGLYRRVGHPVTWLGRAVVFMERRWNRGRRAARLGLGALTVALVVGGALLLGFVIQTLLPQGWLGVAIGGLWHGLWLHYGRCRSMFARSKFRLCRVICQPRDMPCR